jgi:hypothetical protein
VFGGVEPGQFGDVDGVSPSYGDLAQTGVVEKDRRMREDRGGEKNEAA